MPYYLYMRAAGGTETSVPVENLRSEILVVQSAQNCVPSKNHIRAYL